MTLEDKSQYEVHWLTYEYFINWVIRSNVFEMIFMDSVHPELIRRSSDIVRLLAKEDKLDKTCLELIWSNVKDSHEDTMRATLELIQKIALDLSMNCLQFMFNKVNEIPNNSYDEVLIKFLKEYTISAMMNYTTREREGRGNIFQDAYKWLQNKKSNSERLKYFNLDKFWAIAYDETVTKTNIRKMAVDCLIEILGSPQCPLDSKIQYLNLSIHNLIDRPGFSENCKMFINIASKFNMMVIKE